MSDSHDLGWLALGIRPIPAFGHGYPGGWRECPNIVGFQIWKKSDYPLWRTGHPNGRLPKDHIAQISEIK